MPSHWFARRIEALVAALIVLGAAVLRLYRFHELGLNHFDEGAYAMAGLAIYDGEWPQQQFSLQHFLSPPVFFGLTGILMRILGTTSDLVPLGLSTCFGVLTVLLVYRVAREWLGPGAGVGAATLLAMSHSHILYSRVGLTDVAFLFFLLLALQLYAKAEARQGSAQTALVGTTIGLAWNTKYHGWLAGVIAATTLLPLVLRREWKRFSKGVFRIALIAVVASLLYLPWLLYITGQEGGYSALVDNHRQFLEPGNALRNISVHLKTQLYLDGWAGRTAPMLALVAAASVAARRSRRSRRVLLPWLPALLLSGIVVGHTLTATLLAFVGLVTLIPPRSVPRQLILAFATVFSVLTPLYAPYARLLLPWLCSTYLLAGAGIQALLEVAAEARSRVVATTGWAITVAGVLALLVFGVRESAETYQPSDGFRRASAQLAVRIPSQTSVCVIGEPAVVFYLRQRGIAAIHFDHPREFQRDLGEGETFWLISGVYGRREGSFWRWMEQNPDAAERLFTIPVDVNDARLLDDFRPTDARRYRAGPPGEHDLDVFRVTLPRQATPTDPAVSAAPS